MLTPAHCAAVLGSPIAHTLSPALHRAAYAALGLADWGYTAHEVDAFHLADFVAGLDRRWAGLSLTMPLKEMALSVADAVSPLAAEVGAANTLLRRADDGWLADNTDVHGVRAALEGAGLETRTDHAVVIGSGATARSALAALGQLGIRDVTFVVRADVRPATLQQAARQGLTVAHCPYAEAVAVLAAAPVVVNTTPAGAADALAAGLRHHPGGTDGQVLLDVVYDGWPTPLAAAFVVRGAVVAGGMEMLVHQGAEQVYLMTGLRPDVAVMRRAGWAAVAGAADPARPRPGSSG